MRLLNKIVRKGVILIALTAAPLLVPTQAQEVGGITERTHKIGEVEVKAARRVHEAAVVKTTIDTLVLAQTMNASLSELLSNHSPIFIKSYGQGSAATASFRGTAASHTQVEWNGLNINSPMLGQVDFSLIPVFLVDNVSLLHGGSSLQEGSGALGGSVSLNSTTPWGKSLYGSAMQGFGSFGTYQTFVGVGGGNDRLQARVRYFHESSDNDFSFLNNAKLPNQRERQQNGDYRKQGATAGLNYKVTTNDFLALNAWVQFANRNLPPIISYEGRGREERQEDHEIRLSSQWNHYAERWKSELTVGYSTTAVDYFLANTTDLGTFTNVDSRSQIHSFHSKHSAQFTLAPGLTLRTLANANYHSVQIENYLTTEGYKATRIEAGLSGSIHWQMAPRWSSYLILREELVDGRFTPLMGSVGAEYNPLASNALQLKANITRNYHQPTLNDLHWMPGGNPNLRPEQGYTGDLSADYAFRLGGVRMESTLSLYASIIDDWIIWRPSDFRYWTAENIKKVFARGFEGTLKGRSQWGEVNLQLIGNYAFTRTTNQEPTLEGDESHNKQLIYIPVHKANLLAKATWRGYSLSYNGAIVGERFTTSSNEVTRHRLPAYDLHGITLGKEFRFGPLRADLLAKVDNLFNKDYQAILWRAMPGRNYTLLLKLSF